MIDVFYLYQMVLFFSSHMDRFGGLEHFEENGL